MEPNPTNVARVVAQPIVAPLSRAAIFLIVTIKPGDGNRATLRSFCGDLSGIFRAVEYRNIEAGLSCIMGIGSDAWDRLFGQPRPAELHPFREVRAGTRHAVSTPGDFLFHIRARYMDLCFELDDADHGAHRESVVAGGRSARLQKFRRPRSGRLRGWNGESAR